MSNALVSFVFESHGVRAELVGGEPWFCARDVAACLGMTASAGRTALASVDGDDKGVRRMDTPGGRQNMAFVNESGLYDMMMESRKPEARRFRRKVTSEILPSIRKTGTYSLTTIPPEMLIAQGYTLALEAAKAATARAELAEATVEEQRPAVEFALDVIQGEGHFTTREAIKAVGSPVKLGPKLWKDLDHMSAFFIPKANGHERMWRPRHVAHGLGYDCMKRIRGGHKLALVPVWKPKGLPVLREFLISRQRQMAIRR